MGRVHHSPPRPELSSAERLIYRYHKPLRLIPMHVSICQGFLVLSDLGTGK